ncbi:hypothetical protein AMAG_16879 [Allomyces macrogynus ATCC 38327]|uniref:Probable electron transfer flavoprotein subunit alpha n=1 Tax=Allomyces macrogynus (strain ATCC 38327) TaxID=578462 RepID=A0A0L0TCC1_ALLM3|nr:hypothetical protein AMAG_16879 [Allomyces macrogynus ATCC 38327]|eukprot:KNE72397.1 hypothetical protein AMAG_16879 [Allomyces macrogynus ATCC 38327]
MYSLARPLTAVAARSAARTFASAAGTTLVVVEHKNGALLPATLHALTAAKQLGGSITAVIPAADTASATPIVDAMQQHAPSAILVATHSALAKPAVAEIVAPLVAKAAETSGATHIVAAHSSWGKNVIPRVAALLDVSAVSDAVAIVAEDTFTRPIFAGNALATVKATDKVKVVTVRPTAFEPSVATGTPAGAPVSEVAADAATATEFVKEDIVKSDRPELDAAKIVVAGGRALKSAENFQILYDLADKLGNAAVGASRAAVDAGYADNSLQIGQTGKVIAPQLYIGAGISGAIQHLAGMKDSKVIVAINKDPEAPIFAVADYGLEADLFEAVPEMTQKL